MADELNLFNARCASQGENVPHFSYYKLGRTQS